MDFKTWFEGIKLVSYDSFGDVKININGVNYVYHTQDGALARHLYEKGRHQPGKVLNSLKQFGYDKLDHSKNVL